MADSSTDELKPPSATKGVLERFHMHIDKFRETQQEMCFSLTANGNRIRKILNFQSFRSSSESFMDVTDRYSYFQGQLIGKSFD